MDSWKTVKIKTNNGTVKNITKLNKEEILDLYIKCSTDPIYSIETFFSIFDQRVDRVVPFILFPFQKKIIDSYYENRLNLTNKYRQAGISTITCAYLAWYISFRKNRKVAILADKLDTARDELMKDVTDFIEMFPPYLRPELSAPDKATHKGYNNGSEVKAFATKKFRGMTPTFVFWDETAHAEKGDDLWTQLWPTLSTGGHCAFVSCVVKDTFIWTHNGLEQMENFVDLNLNKGTYFNPMYTVLGKDTTRKGNLLHNNGTQRTKYIKSKYSELEGTVTHKIFTYNSGSGEIGYNVLNTTSKNDLLAIQYGLKYSGNGEFVKNISSTNINKKLYKYRLDDQFMYLISSYILKGYKTFSQVPYIYFDNISEDELNNLLLVIKGKLKIKDINISYNIVTKTLKIKSFKLNNLLTRIGIDKFKSTKKLPPFLLGLKYKLLFSLLKNIFVINGSLNLKSNSSLFLKQIQQLLINAGYLSELIDYSLYTKKGGLSMYNDFELIVNGLSLDQFVKNEKIVYDYDIPLGFINFLNKNLVEGSQLPLVYYKYSELKKIIIDKGYNHLNEYVNDTIYYDKIIFTKLSRNTTYDFSLPNNENDKYCHSVIYNGIIGHQTPNGLDPVFYKTYDAVKNGRSKFVVNEIYWFEDPRYNTDLVWQKKVIDPNNENDTITIEVEENDLTKFKKLIADGYMPTSSWFEDMCREYKYDSHKINQELRGDFLGSGSNFIINEDIKFYEDNHQTLPIRTELDENIWIFDEPEKDASYVMCVDVSSGTSEDSSSIVMLKNENNLLTQVMEFQGKVSPDILGEICFRFGVKYNNAYAVVDITGGIGVGTIQKLFDLGYTNIHYSQIRNEKIKDRLISYAKYVDDKVYLPGFMIGTNRGMILVEMKRVIEMREIIIKSSRLLSEFKTFVTHPTRVADHRRSFHDDIIMGLGIGIYVISYDIISMQNDTESYKKVLEAMRKVNGLITDESILPIMNNGNQIPINSQISHNWLFKPIK